MEALNFEKLNDLFTGFTLSNEEMIKIRGGGEPIVLPTPPIIRI